MPISARSLPFLLFSATLAACATVQPRPIPFDLFEGEMVHKGWFHPEMHTMEVDIGDTHYQGHYIIATSTAVSQGLWLRRGFPNDTVTTINSNSAKAVMNSPDGKHLFCDFLFEARRVLGECKSAANLTYRLVSQGQ